MTAADRAGPYRVWIFSYFISYPYFSRFFPKM